MKNNKQIKTSIERDAFFTNPVIAKRIVAKVNRLYPFRDFDNVIEPSAGAGAIYQHLPKRKRIGIDIEPMMDGIIKTDFFDFQFPVGKNIVVGNPPFGKNSDLAVKFFNKCAESAEVIAFIIPRGWSKAFLQNKLDGRFELYSNVVLPNNIFSVDGKTKVVGCCLQVWAKTTPQKAKAKWETWNDKVKQETLNAVIAYHRKHELGFTKSLRINKRGPAIKKGAYYLMNKGTKIRFVNNPKDFAKWSTTPCFEEFSADFQAYSNIWKVGCEALNAADLQMIHEINEK